MCVPPDRPLVPFFLSHDNLVRDSRRHRRIPDALECASEIAAIRAATARLAVHERPLIPKEGRCPFHLGRTRSIAAPSPSES